MRGYKIRAGYSHSVSELRTCEKRLRMKMLRLVVCGAILLAQTGKRKGFVHIFLVSFCTLACSL